MVGSFVCVNNMCSQVMHIIGCCKDSDVFRHADDGSEFADNEKWIVESESNWIDKQITKWVTPGVR